MQAVVRIEELPEAPLDASVQFHADHLTKAIAELRGESDQVVLILPAAASEHDDWRRAIARDLARKFAPKSAVVIAGGSESAQTAMLAYLRGAPGITGQYLPLHD